MMILVVMAVPWSSYYKSELNWSEAQGIAAFLAALSVLNCLSLLVRIQIIEGAGTSFTDLKDYHVAMAASAAANIFLWSGMAMWFVAGDLHLSPFLCFFIAAAGALAHTLLHYWRWRNNRSTTTVLLLAIYAAILTGIIWGYATGASFK
ncbi:MAG: hypothetical protein AB7W16_11750 [Candidatus Obscuribacterales bacterium]